MSEIKNSILHLLSSFSVLVRGVFIKVMFSVASFNPDGKSILSGILIMLGLRRFRHLDYRSLLFVALSRYNLGRVRFAMAQWVFCVVMYQCCLELPFVLINLADYADYTVNFFCNPYVSPNLPNPGVSIESTPDLLNKDLDEEDLSKKPKIKNDLIVNVCVLTLLYLGFCLGNSGG